MGKMKNPYRMVLLIGLNLLLAGLIVFFLLGKIPKVAYINTVAIYDGFKLKMELEDELISIQNRQQIVLDSLKHNYNTSLAKTDIPAEQRETAQRYIRYLEQQYVEKEQQFEENNRILINRYQERIYKQLNQYVADFAKEHHYDLVMGASGNGQLMYAEPERDLTEEVLSYINEKYEGNE